MSYATSALKPQSPYKKFTLKPYHIKYYGIFFVCLMAFWAIKVFINYATIESSIAKVRKEAISIAHHTQYAQLQAYMYSRPESKTFIAHDYGILAPGERIMSDIRVLDVLVETGVQQNSGSMITTGELLEQRLTPRKSWARYFAEKM